MDVLENLNPDRVFYYFEEICKIPHGSGNTKLISDYCVEFAKKNNLFYIQDESNNVIIKKNAQGTDSKNTVVIQGHLDMVCEKEFDADFDFEKDALKLYVDGDYIKAKGTTLGGDDGIAIAYALAVLESKDIIHPDIEAVFTVDEEIGLLGAQAIDLSSLKGKYLLNIDTETEGVFTVSCAGGATVKCTLPLCYEKMSGEKYSVKIYDLKGGHSGVEIDKLRANSNVLGARLIFTLLKNANISLINVSGGLKDNAIPNLTNVEFFSDKNVDELINEFYKDIKKEYRVSDEFIKIDFSKKTDEAQALDLKETKKAVSFLLALPNGILNMDLEIKDLVKTSLNMGILSMDSEQLSVSFSVRSSLSSEKKAMIEKMEAIAYLTGANISVSGEYPAWEYNPDSYLREVVSKSYMALYKEEPKFEAIHAGLECGVLSEKIPGLDAVSFGPEILDIHTPKERLSISSTKRVWEFLLSVLGNI